MGRMVVAVVAFVAGVTGGAHGAILCEKKSGVVVVREACRKRETPVDAGALPFSDTLPSGKTLRGTYFVTRDDPGAGEELATGVSFGLRIATNPTPDFVARGTTPPTECPGTATAPAAQPGHVCVYEVWSLNASGGGVCTPQTCSATKTSEFGVLVYTSASGTGRAQSAGVWAVTAP